MSRLWRFVDFRPISTGGTGFLFAISIPFEMNAEKFYPTALVGPLLSTRGLPCYNARRATLGPCSRTICQYRCAGRCVFQLLAGMARWAAHRDRLLLARKDGVAGEIGCTGGRGRRYVRGVPRHAGIRERTGIRGAPHQVARRLRRFSRALKFSRGSQGEGHLKKRPRWSPKSSHRGRPTRHGDDKPGLARSGRRAGSVFHAQE